MNGIELTMLNSMAGREVEAALDRHVELGLPWLDLKDGMFGKGIADLDEAETQKLAGMIEARGLRVYCLSSQLLFGPIELGRDAFLERDMASLDNLLKVARVLRPRFVRLLGTRTSKPIDAALPALLEAETPWLFDAYRLAVDRIVEAGFEATIENEVSQCILHDPASCHALFDKLDRSKVCFTWDVQNMWEMGTFPTMAVYEQLRPLIGFLHFKGGRLDPNDSSVVYRSKLRDASYDVAGILRAAMRDGVSPVVCLNSPHGKEPGGDWLNNLIEDDLAYLREVAAKENA